MRQCPYKNRWWTQRMAAHECTYPGKSRRYCGLARGDVGLILALGLRELNGVVVAMPLMAQEWPSLLTSCLCSWSSIHHRLLCMVCAMFRAFVSVSYAVCCYWLLSRGCPVCRVLCLLGSVCSFVCSITRYVVCSRPPILSHASCLCGGVCFPRASCCFNPPKSFHTPPGSAVCVFAAGSS